MPMCIEIEPSFSVEGNILTKKGCRLFVRE